MTQLPPHNLDAEEALLGSIIIGGKDVMRAIVNYVQFSDFYSERNQTIFNACLKLYKDVKEKAINNILIAHTLASSDHLENIGGAAFLSHLSNCVATHLDAKYYAEIVSNLAKARNLITLAEKISQIGYETDKNPDDMVGNVDDLWRGFKTTNATPSKLINAETAGNDIIRLVEKYQSKEVVPSWGFTNLDNITAGIYPEYIVFGARPSIGKTQLILDISENLVRTGKHVLLASAEMQDTQIYERKLSTVLGMSILQLRKTGLTDEQQVKVIELAGDVSVSTIHYLTGDLYFRNIYKEACYLKEKGQLDVVFVDYIGALRDCYTENKDSQATRVSRLSNKIQSMVHELKTPVIVASQLNREVEHRNDGFKSQTKSRRPQLSDLRDSGSLEQDADVVFLLHRDEDDKGDISPVLKLRMAKNRQLGQGKAMLIYDYKLKRYVDYTSREFEG